MPRALAILKYVPAVLCAWVVMPLLLRPWCIAVLGPVGVFMAFLAFASPANENESVLVQSLALVVVTFPFFGWLAALGWYFQQKVRIENARGKPSEVHQDNLWIKIGLIALGVINLVFVVLFFSLTSGLSLLVTNSMIAVIFASGSVLLARELIPRLR
jgi:hypothetical protein